MPNFSFGEWYYDPASGYIRRKPNEKCSARIIGTGSEGEKNEEAKANARLITAAPDMYGLICVLMHEGIIPETLPCGYRSLKRLHGIIEAVTGNNFRWDTSPHSLNCPSISHATRTLTNLPSIASSATARCTQWQNARVTTKCYRMASRTAPTACYHTLTMTQLSRL